MTTCPGCNQRLESTAIVAAFLDDPQWSFWGVEGCRWIVCRGAGFIPHYTTRTPFLDVV